jgi:dihydroorotase
MKPDRLIDSEYQDTSDKLIIKGGIIVNEGLLQKASILIAGDRIIKIFKQDEALPSQVRVIDATGMLVIPGVIDDQVHFREPGSTHKGTIASESAAAILGGVTSYMDMPNNNPPALTIESLELKNNIASKDSFANYSFYLGASNNNIDQIILADPSEICGVKVFMGSSTGNMLVDNPDSLEKIFSDSPLLIATHCEDETTIKRNLAEAVNKYGEDLIPFREHCIIRDRQSCIKSSSKAIDLAKKHNSRLHVLHISTQEEIAMIKEAQKSFPNITGEVCIHYMLLDNSMYDEMGSKMKCNPSIKERSDRLAIIEAVKDGTIKVVATDHAPHTLKEKSGNYMTTPSGLPLIQHSLQLMIELHLNGIFTLEEVVDRMCHSPALNFKIENRGFIREGYYADIVIIDLNKEDTISTSNPAYLCGWSPFYGKTLRSSIVHTFVNGVHVVNNGELTGNKGGKKLNFYK